VLDKHSEVFSEVPGLCLAAQHEIPISAAFKPKRLRAYKVPEAYQTDVSRQIQELLSLGFMEASTSPQTSPLVVVLKAKDKDGHRAVRVAIDYRYVNKYTAPSVVPLEDISEIIQQIGKSKFIGSFDAKTRISPVSCRWLTSFICNDGQFQWTRTPFGMRSSGTTFVRAVYKVLNNIREYTKSYVDRYLYKMKSAGFTLGLTKSEFVRPRIKFVGHIIGSGTWSVDPEKFAAVHELKEPESKLQVRQIVGFFSFFREYIPNFATICKPLTDLTSKRVSVWMSGARSIPDA